jgi:hypothetical protein
MPIVFLESYHHAKKMRFSLRSGCGVRIIESMPTQLANQSTITISMTHYLSMIKKAAVLAAILLLPASVFCQVPGVIGVKFGFTSGAGYAVSTDLAPTDAAGVLVDNALAVTNWNDLLVANASDLSAAENVSWPVAQDSAGNNLSGVTLTPAGWNDGWYSGGNDCPNARLLEAFWKLNLSDANHGVGTNDGDVYATFTFAGLPDSTYDVYVYVNDNNGNYWGNIQANSVVAVGSSITGAGFNGDDTDPCASTPQLHTATGFGNPANYVEMPAVATTAGGTILITVLSQGGGDFAVPGIELIPTGTVVDTGPPIISELVESPATADLGILAGTAVTLTGAAVGAPTITYQWQTDGGSGNTPTNIPGATSTNLAVNTTGWSPATYVYDFVASNSLGTSTSDTLTILIPTTSVARSIGFQFEGGGGSETLLTGEAAGFVPQQNWNVDNESSGGTFDSNVVDSTGAPVDTTVTVVYHNGQYHSSPATGTADDILMSGGYWSGGGYVISVTNVPYSSYNIYLYMLNDDNPNRRYGFTLGTQTYWGSVFDGNGYSVPPYTLDTETTELPEGSQMQATLVEFTGITGSTFTINGETPDGNVALMGMEIVNPDAGPPIADVIRLTPSEGTIYAGIPVVLTEVVISGATPLFYQWLTDGGSGGTLTNVPAATNGTLSVNTLPLQTGTYNYEVIVTNSLGSSTSAVLGVTITASAPVVLTDITASPSDEAYVGETVTFSAVIGGTLPILYQWMLDTGSGPAPIPSASNPTAITSTLILTNVQIIDVGTYSLVTTNSVGGGQATTPLGLTVLTDLPAPGAGTFGASVISNNPFAYWRLNETEDPSTGVLPAYDYSGHNLDGVYGANTLNGFNNIAGPQPPSFPGFEADNTALQTQNKAPDSFVQVPSLDLNTNTVTITMWINPTGAQTVFNSLFKYQNLLDTDAAGLGFGPFTNASLSAALGYTWNSNSAATYNWNSGLYPPEGQWSFVALVITPANATIYLYYIDPITTLPDLYSASNPLTNGVETFDTLDGGTNVIGSDPNNLPGRAFNGDIDEVAIFNQSLTSDQILAMFSEAAGLGKIAPQISAQPSSIGAFAGENVKFAATGINGTSPFTYQWQYITASATNNLTDGGDISGSKTATLSISNVASADVGSYQLVVSNSVGTTLSSNATLTVVTPVPGSYEAAVVQYQPLAYWPLNETNDPSTGTAVAFEYVSFFNGTYGVTGQNGFNGIVGPEAPAFPGFPANNPALETSGTVAGSYVSASGGDLIATNLTYAMWINPSGPVENWAGLLMDRSAAGEGLGFGGSVDGTGMSEIAYTWNQNNQNTWGFNSLLYPTAGQWSFVALVIEPSKGTLYLVGTNGVVQSAVNAIPHDSEEFAVAWHIGNDAVGDPGRTFPGRISSVGVFLSALTSAQIETLADIGFGIMPPVVVDIAPNPSVPGTLSLSWSQGTLLQAPSVTGPWTTNTATSPYTVDPTNAQLFFKIKVQ